MEDWHGHKIHLFAISISLFHTVCKSTWVKTKIQQQLSFQASLGLDKWMQHFYSTTLNTVEFNATDMFGFPVE